MKVSPFFIAVFGAFCTVFAHAAKPQKFAYYSPQKHFSITLTDSRIKLHGEKDLAIAIKPCNKSVIQKFWRNIGTQAESFPVLKKAKQKRKKTSHIVFKNQKRSLAFPIKAPPVGHLDAEFDYLMLEAEKACG